MACLLLELMAQHIKTVRNNQPIPCLLIKCAKNAYGTSWVWKYTISTHCWNWWSVWHSGSVHKSGPLITYIVLFYSLHTCLQLDMEYNKFHLSTWHCIMVVIMTAAPCLNGDLHTNSYESETWIRLNYYFNVNANVPIHFASYVIRMNICIWIFEYVHSIVFMSPELSESNHESNCYFCKHDSTTIALQYENILIDDQFSEKSTPAAFGFNKISFYMFNIIPGFFRILIWPCCSKHIHVHVSSTKFSRPRNPSQLDITVLEHCAREWPEFRRLIYL